MVRLGFGFLFFDVTEAAELVGYALDGGLGDGGSRGRAGGGNRERFEIEIRVLERFGEREEVGVGQREREKHLMSVSEECDL